MMENAKQGKAKSCKMLFQQLYIYSFLKVHAVLVLDAVKQYMALVLLHFTYFIHNVFSKCG